MCVILRLRMYYICVHVVLSFLVCLLWLFSHGQVSEATTSVEVEVAVIPPSAFLVPVKDQVCGLLNTVDGVECIVLRFSDLTPMERGARRRVVIAPTVFMCAPTVCTKHACESSAS